MPLQSKEECYWRRQAQFKCESHIKFIIIQVVEMSIEQKNFEAQTVFGAKDKNISASQFTNLGVVFQTELTVSQANAIMALLPKNYSIHVDRSVKQKRTVKKNFASDSKSKVIKEVQDSNLENYASMKEQPFQNLSYSDMVKRCQKILTALKRNKNSWPFLEPVDPIAMGIPHYVDIIKEPMDLATVSRNLAEQKYITISQFYADIELIIQNSLLFNKTNPEFTKITNDFKKSFDRLVAQPIRIQQPSHNRNQRKGSKVSHYDEAPLKVQKIKSQPKQFLMISEKKQLAMKIKCLPLKNIVEIAQLVTDGPVTEKLQLNLETLSPMQLRKIQDYIDNLEMQREKGSRKDIRVERGDESSFQSDSDS